MKLIIDVPDEKYKSIREYYENVDIVEATYSYIYHGIPLPKNHGRLIDADALINYLNRDFLTFERELYYDVNPANALAEAFNIIKDTSTIIEADKESED